MSASPAVAFEISCRYIEPILDVAIERCGRVHLGGFLDSWQIELEYLRNHANWVSQRFVEDLTIFVVERVGIELLEARVASTARSPQALGFLVPLLRAFGSPRLGYSHLPRVVSLVSKVSEVRVLAIGSGFADVEFRQDPTRFRLASPYLCRLRKATLQAGPTFFGMPAAHIEEPECQHRGDARCLFHIRWPERSRWLVFGPVSGLGGAVGGWAGQDLLWALGGAVAGFAAWGAIRSLRSRRHARRIERDHFAEIELVAQAAERRFLEHQSDAVPYGPRRATTGPEPAWTPATYTESEEGGYHARPPTALVPGAVLADRYEVEAPIARGGMAMVVRARDRQGGQAVALKILRPELAGERAWIERLEREFRLARTIEHPNVCRVLDLGESGGHVFLVLELAQAGTLADLLKRAERTREERVAEARAVVAGLAAVHRAGIVHRDLTPRNVLRMDDARLAVADFGLAIDPSETTTLMGGTPGYMAPEVLKGMKPSFTSDVWQLGVVLHQILVGDRPRAVDAMAAANGAADPLGPLGAVVRSCLSDDPTIRPADAQRVLELWTEAERLAAAPSVPALAS